MSDIVERLRGHIYASNRCSLEDCKRKADEIERLRAESGSSQVDRYVALLNDEIIDNGRLRDEIERLQADFELLRVVLNDIDELVDDYADADDGQPNIAMRIMTMVSDVRIALIKPRG